MRPLRFHPAARDEYIAALRRAEDERMGRGERLQTEVAKAVSRAERLPESGPLLPGHDARHDVRAFRVRRFRYSVIVARIGDDRVVVALAHHSREPGYWARRLG